MHLHIDFETAKVKMTCEICMFISWTTTPLPSNSKPNHEIRRSEVYL